MGLFSATFAHFKCFFKQKTQLVIDWKADVKVKVFFLLTMKVDSCLYSCALIMPVIMLSEADKFEARQKMLMQPHKSSPGVLKRRKMLDSLIHVQMDAFSSSGHACKGHEKGQFDMLIWSLPKEQFFVPQGRKSFNQTGRDSSAAQHVCAHTVHGPGRGQKEQPLLAAFCLTRFRRAFVEGGRRRAAF